MYQPWHVEASQLTDLGRKRSDNQDFVGCYEPKNPEILTSYGRLYLVADGVGGGTEGDKASRYTVQRILRDYYSHSQPDPCQRLISAIKGANSDIFNYNQSSTNGKMATTLVAALIHGLNLVVASVGDSRAYLIHQGSIEQITRDHSLVAYMVQEGLLSPEQARHHPRRNVIMRSLGMREAIEIDCFVRTLTQGDTIVLCSDGLTGHVSDQEIADMATRYPAQAAAQELIDMANIRGGSDNISVSVIHILPVSNIIESLRNKNIS